jgi:hypothetical protein
MIFWQIFHLHHHQRLEINLFLRGAPRAFHSCLLSNGVLYVAGGMQNHKGKWGTGADFWSTEGELNGWKRYVTTN